MTEPPSKPRVFVDADALIAGSASTTGASHIVLQLAEITLVQAITCQQVISEATRNLEDKLPGAVPAFRMIVNRALSVVADPTHDELEDFTGCAHPKDLPILVAALRERCPFLITFNTTDFEPGHEDVTVLRPGQFISRVREQLALLAPSEGNS